VIADERACRREQAVDAVVVGQVDRGEALRWAVPTAHPVTQWFARGCSTIVQDVTVMSDPI
jgi:hypothetical protein